MTNLTSRYFQSSLWFWSWNCFKTFKRNTEFKRQRKYSQNLAKIFSISNMKYFDKSGERIISSIHQECKNMNYDVETKNLGKIWRGLRKGWNIICAMNEMKEKARKMKDECKRWYEGNLQKNLQVREQSCVSWITIVNVFIKGQNWHFSGW